MIIDKIKSLNHLTVQEKYLVDYILENPRHIFKKNINEIAKESYTSVATVSRLCKKLGFRGYTDFKFEYVSEYKNLLELFNDFKIEPFSIDTSLDETLNKVELLHKRSIEYTKSFFDKKSLENIKIFMQECQFIEIYGTGLNYSLADSYRLCFEEIGIQANAYSSFNPMHIEYLKNRNRKDTLCILLTHTGQNEEMLKIAKQLDFANTNTVVICDNLNREICKYCDEAIVIMTTKNTIELSNSVYMTSLQYIFDILTSMHLISNYSHIEKTTKIVDEMKIQGDIK